MNLEQIKDMLNKQLLNLGNRCLSETELLVLQGIFQNQTYDEIAQQGGYSSSYFANVVAPELYRKLSEVSGKRVTKKNCRAILQAYSTTPTQPITTPLRSELGNSSPSYPCGAVPMDSPLFMFRFS